MITLDASDRSVLVLCTDCPWLVELAQDRDEAWSIARRHERAEHPAAKQADRAVIERATRRARRGSPRSVGNPADS